ncbi:hypothetical protein ABZS86_04645 [Streptomyces sp. NPDC005355]|uniref:hypothetical protein n=1 Tax=Streptomyces sp. NPDC005355 TaxID=3157038 RepID=UPI0033BE7507
MAQDLVPGIELGELHSPVQGLHGRRGEVLGLPGRRLLDPLGNDLAGVAEAVEEGPVLGAVMHPVEVVHGPLLSLLTLIPQVDLTTSVAARVASLSKASPRRSAQRLTVTLGRLMASAMAFARGRQRGADAGGPARLP